MSKERYEKIYSEHECVFGLEPVPIVRRIREYIPSGMILDLGAGEGRNALFLAAEGFKITAVDSSKTAVEKLRKSAQEKGIKLDAAIDDIRDYIIREGYDAILAILVFHHLSHSEVVSLVEKIKMATKREE